MKHYNTQIFKESYPTKILKMGSNNSFRVSDHFLASVTGQTFTSKESEMAWPWSFSSHILKMYDMKPTQVRSSVPKEASIQGCCLSSVTTLSIRTLAASISCGLERPQYTVNCRRFPQYIGIYRCNMKDKLRQAETTKWKEVYMTNLILILLNPL